MQIKSLNETECDRLAYSLFQVQELMANSGRAIKINVIRMNLNLKSIGRLKLIENRGFF